MAKNYMYALSIDLGIASIGTSLIRLNNDDHALDILDAGVRIFDTPLGAAERRAARQARKTIRRRRQRLQNLRKFLQAHNLLPTQTEALKELLARSPYRLRAHGVKHKFTSLHELGRCLLHIAKFRGAGFLTQSEDTETHFDEATPSSKKKETTTTAFYRNLEMRINQEQISLGEFFMQRLRDNSVKKTVRRRARFITENLVDYAVPRFLVKDDFYTLWERQAAYYPELTPEIKEKIYEIIFSDRPHAPYATGVCSLNPDSGEERLPRLHRLSEERRIYEQINNLRYQTSNAVHTLQKDMRDALIEVAFNGIGQNKTSIKKELQKYTNEKIIKINMPDEAISIKPLSHVQAFANINHWQKLSTAQQDEILDFIANPRLDVQDVHSRLMPEEQFLLSCAEKLHIPTNPQGLRTLSFSLALLPKDRSALGITATKRILEKLKAGVEADGQQSWYPLTFREAADLCGYEAEEESKRGLAGSIEELPYYGQILRHDVTPVHPWHTAQAAEEEATYGRVPNPVVHVALNQLRKVVNEIIKIYGKPQRIHIELAREFGMSQKRRDELDAERKKRTKENELFDAELRKVSIRPSRKNRTKYRLWKEQDHKDAYTLEDIAITDFELCDIDHIIPQSRGGSDTYSNLALTKREVNLAKSDKYAYDFIQETYPSQWQHILQKISDKKVSKAKSWRFMPDAQNQFESKGDEDQTDHRLTDTSYMAKMAARYLSVLCGNVIPVRGGMTARLRHAWGLDGLEYELMGIPIRKEIIDELTGEVKLDAWGKEVQNPAWKGKARIDHRHHALDAIVLACTTRSMVQQLAKAEKRNNRLPDFPPPFGHTAADFRRSVLQALQKVKVSPKAEHGLNDKLHDATKYRVLCRDPRDAESYIITYRRAFTNIKSKKDVDNIVFSLGTLPQDMPIIKEFHEECLKQHHSIENKYHAAEQVLIERNALNREQGLREINIDEANIVKEALRLAQKHDNIGHKYRKVEPKNLVGVCLKKQCGFEPKNNLRVDFYIKKDGSIGWECISRFNANQKSFVPSWQEQGGKLLWSVFKGDVLELTVDAAMKAKLKMPVPEGKVLCVVQKFSKGICQFNLLHDARNLGGNDNTSRWISGNSGLITFTKTQARKVELSPFGKVLHKHKRLWHGKKKAQD